MNNNPCIKVDTYYLSVLNVISALAVVFLHANGIFWSHPTGSTWISANIIESFFIFAVPVFFMISGCTLIDYSDRYSTKTFFKKRIKKTVRAVNELREARRRVHDYRVVLKKMKY